MKQNQEILFPISKMILAGPGQGKIRLDFRKFLAWKGGQASLEAVGVPVPGSAQKPMHVSLGICAPLVGMG